MKRVQLVGRGAAVVALCATLTSPLTPKGPTGAEAAPVVNRSGPVVAVTSADGLSGYGYYEGQRAPCLTDVQRWWVRKKIAENRERLLGPPALWPRGAQPVTKFEWPLNPVGEAAACFNYYAISGFVDQDPNYPDQLLDYNCGGRTYDLPSGYNHKGVDLFGWPFYWNWMDDDAIEIVAAADGTIVYKSEGYYDQNCGFGSANSAFLEPQWNAIYVVHADGSEVWYGHMKRNSVTPKGVGDNVVAGEYLGVVGSSGFSTGPHLHLETYDGSGNLIEPHAGPCNGMNSESWWVSQRPYYQSAVHRLMIGTAQVEYPPCPGRAITHETSVVARGTSGVFTTFYRDQLKNQRMDYRIRRPDGSEAHYWIVFFPYDYWTVSYWWWTRPIGATEPTGEWTFEVEYEGRTYRRKFTVI